MSTLNGQKLNYLQRLLPEGLVTDAAWLEARGYSRALRSRYVASGWLEQPARGSYRRPGGSLLWQHAVVSLQSLLNVPVAVGGRTALELHGFAHFVAAGSPSEVHLYASGRLPGWVAKLPLDTSLVFHNASRLFPASSRPRPTGASSWHPDEQQFAAPTPPDEHLTRLTWGQWNWPLILSTPERAILELLDEVPRRETFDQADKIMDGLHTLSPRRLQVLLEQCRSIKVKRLFLWFAERHRFDWLPRLHQERIDLGRGKRMLVPGGRLDTRYLITVPRDLDGDAPNADLNELLA